MGFRDHVAKDMANIMNTNEFAETVVINGTSIDAIEDGDDLQKRIRTDYEGMMVGDLLLHVTESEWEKVPRVSHPPRQGEAVNIKNRPATVFTSSRTMGMLDIVFQYKGS